MKRRDTSYIKIWMDAYGDIPKDADGRSYEIHHIDGDASNNDLSNLACIPINEHYEIHLQQGDLMAARYIAMRMGANSELTKSLMSRAQKTRVKNGTHNFLTENGGSDMATARALARVENGTHHFVTGQFEDCRRKQYNISVEERKSAGTYHMLVDNPTHKMIANGTHNLLGPNQNKIMLANGRHPSQMKKECPYCNKIIDVANYARYHGEKCKVRMVNDNMG